MSETANYNLHCADSDEEYVRDFWEKIGGKDNSNMHKIDKALGEKAEKSREAALTLLADGWVGAASPFTQDLAVEGMTAEQNGSITVSNSATPEQWEAARQGMLTVTRQTDGVLTVSAAGDKPEVDIPVTITLLG